MSSIFAKTPTGEIQLTITIPAAEIKVAYEKAFTTIAENTELPGFRKGKAPKNLLLEKIDKAKVYEEVLHTIVPENYIKAVQEHKISPVINPKVELLKAKEDEDWEIRATTCEAPEVDLGNYKENVKTAIHTPKLWTPGDGKEGKPKEETQEEKTQKAINALLESVKIEFPEMILDEEVNHALSNLINQTNSLGMTVEQYLNSIGKTSEQIRAEYREKVKKDLTLQMALNKIAREEKLEAAEKEIEDFIGSLGDPKVKESFSSDPMQKELLKGIILRRKALDFISQI